MENSIPDSIWIVQVLGKAIRIDEHTGRFSSSDKRRTPSLSGRYLYHIYLQHHDLQQHLEGTQGTSVQGVERLVGCRIALEAGKVSISQTGSKISGLHHWY